MKAVLVCWLILEIVVAIAAGWDMAWHTAVLVFLVLAFVGLFWQIVDLPVYPAKPQEPPRAPEEEDYEGRAAWKTGDPTAPDSGSEEYPVVDVRKRPELDDEMGKRIRKALERGGK